ncbi:MAG: hypothetical protein R3C55_07035 [Parvularculaceae bacterium]
MDKPMQDAAVDLIRSGGQKSIALQHLRASPMARRAASGRRSRWRTLRLCF